MKKLLPLLVLLGAAWGQHVDSCQASNPPMMVPVYGRFDTPASYCSVATIPDIDFSYWRDSVWDANGDASRYYPIWRVALTFPIAIAGIPRELTLVLPISDTGKTDTIWLP